MALIQAATPDVTGTTGASQFERELQRARQQLALLEQATGAGTWEWDGGTGAIEASAAWLRLHALHPQPARIDREAFAALLHPEDADKVISQLENMLDGETNVVLEYRVALPDGEVRWISATATSAANRVAGVAIDITDRRRESELAAEARRDFERFFNLIPNLACIVSNDGHFKKVNAAWAATLGYELDEVLATPMLDFIHPDDLESTQDEIAKQSRAYRTKHFVNRYRCKDGSYRLFDWTTTFNRDESTRFGVATDVTEQRQWENSLRESEERFRIMADTCPAIIWVTDAQGAICLTNRMCREFFGATLEQIPPGDQLRLLIHPDDHAPLTKKFLLAVRERAPFQMEARLRRADGEWRWTATHAEPRMSLSGEYLGHIGISPDITDRKLAEVALLKAKEAAELANRSKSEFLANMSHEIRTPMNGVIGLTDLALDTELNSEQYGYLQGVKTSAESLLRILNDILDFSKIEAGKLEFEAIEFDIRHTVETILKLLGSRAAAKGLELGCGFGAEVPWRAVGDPGRLQQILVNLTGNAVKFTERGEVILNVELASETTAGFELHFSVRDTGIGIPAEKRQHIFSAFAQADASSTRKFGGTGLGLSISSQLIAMMGGRIWLESVFGTGSTFHFTVQLGKAVAASEEQRTGVELLAGRSILVVDDNQANRDILNRMFNNRGLRTTLADCGLAALEALERAAEAERAFDLIVVDAQMPGMDGITLAQRIRADRRYNRARIVLLASGVHRGDAERCRELDISACLAKPAGEMELLEALSGPALPVAGVAHSEPGLPRTADDRPLNILVVEDNRVNRVVATRLLSKRNHNVRTASDGREALEIIENETFDCVLMDVQMPILDGFETTAAIRAKESDSGRHLPIIAMTARAMTGDLERCLAAGMDAYLTKPIKADDVFATIDRVMAEVMRPGQPPSTGRLPSRSEAPCAP